MTPYDKIMQIRKKMLEDYYQGLLPDCFNPYFEWKTGMRQLSQISRNEAINMMEYSSELIDVYYDKHPYPFKDISPYTDDNPWQNYEGFGEDKYIVSYLETIDYELNNLWTGGFF